VCLFIVQQSDFAKLDRDGRGEITKAAFVDAIIETVSTTSTNQPFTFGKVYCCVKAIGELNGATPAPMMLTTMCM
jgi:hypothetical protein